MGSGCRDDFITEQAKLANQLGRIWMTARGPWSQISEATHKATGDVPKIFEGELVVELLP